MSLVMSEYEKPPGSCKDCLYFRVKKIDPWGRFGSIVSHLVPTDKDIQIDDENFTISYRIGERCKPCDLSRNRITQINFARIMEGALCSTDQFTPKP
ncbi:MAG TPA: hypothetical protein VI819_00115 [Patescibacteria group bacterium]|nr:hypothetical protein [Patescibacteria group bacterium]